jgi:peptide-methionine (S)-S-oxide reductase
MKEIYVAGGCFWGVEAYFKQLKGIIDTSVGYIDGNRPNPTYEMVCDGRASHAEACYLSYDPKEISLESLCEHLFRISNPFSKFKQGNDVGRQYRTGIYFVDDEDEHVVLNFMKTFFNHEIDKVQTEVKKALDYALAETYHQKYLDKNPNGYCHVNLGLAKKEERK